MAPKKPAGGRPGKQARPPSAEDGAAKKKAAPGPQGGPKKSGNMLTVDEVHARAAAPPPPLTRPAPRGRAAGARSMRPCAQGPRGGRRQQRRGRAGPHHAAAPAAPRRRRPAARVPPSPLPPPPPPRNPAPSPPLPPITKIEHDRITRTAKKHWAPPPGVKPPPFSAEVVETLYQQELGGGRAARGAAVKRVQMLEVSQYLEAYLWPNFEAESASVAHVMSIVAMVNQKCREGVPAWSCFHTREVRGGGGWGGVGQ
jgi:hypothetical protein